MKNKINIGSIIGERLAERGMSKTEFAKRIDLSRGTIYNILNASSIDIKLLQKISIVLDYDFLELYWNKRSKN